MMENYKKVHMIGIGGIGMSAVAKLLVSYNKNVTGSDMGSTDILLDLKKRGIKIYTKHADSNIEEVTDLLIYSSAIPHDNEELVKAKQLGIKTLTYFEFIGELSLKYSTIVVTGTHGKSTTTAMLGMILEEAGYDPTVIVGTLVPGFKDGNLRVGRGRFLVIEGCEYKANMMSIEPEMVVLTNIEMDHPDFYTGIDHVIKTFQKYIDKLTGKGLLIINRDDSYSEKIVSNRSVGYSVKINSDYYFKNRVLKDGKQIFGLYRKENGDEKLSEIILNVPGMFNAQNAIAAISAAMELGVTAETCMHALKRFNGTWRRFERVGMLKGSEVVLDYGHHPTAIKETVGAACELFQNKKIVLCYQPHQHARTKELFDDFVNTLIEIDASVLLLPIYDVIGRNEASDISSKQIVEKVRSINAEKNIIYSNNILEAKKDLEKTLDNQTVLIIMGAGDVDKFARDLVK